MSVAVAARVMDAVAGVHVEAEAPAVQLTVSGFANPEIGDKVAAVAVPRPATTLPEMGARLRLKSTPTPVSATLTTALLELLVFTAKTPVSVPVVSGLKTTVIVQLDRAASELPHVVVSA